MCVWEQETESLVAAQAETAAQKELLAARQAQQEQMAQIRAAMEAVRPSPFMPDLSPLLES